MIAIPISILGQVYLHAPTLWPAAVAATAAVVLAVLVLYPAQLSELRWPWRWVLPGLRLLAAVALAISLLKPIAIRPATADERGAVVVLIDRSRSMGVVDNSRTPAQLVALADALGKLPNDVRGDNATGLGAGVERLRGIAADVRGAGRPGLCPRLGRDIQYRQKRLHDLGGQYSAAALALAQKAESLSDAEELTRQLSDLASLPDVTSRDPWRVKVPEQIAQAADAVIQYQTSLDDRLYESNSQVRSAADAVAALSRFALVEKALLRPGGIVDRSGKESALVGFGLAADISPVALLSDQKPAASLNAAPDGDQSDLTAGIARAVAGRAVRAVVLFSDGRQVGGDATIVSGLTPADVPIYTISAAAPDPPADVSFATVTAPSSVFAGQTLTVKTELRHNGISGPVVDLHCQIGQEPEQVRKIPLQDGKPAEAEFSARLAKAGAQRIRLWFPPVKGEATADNNRAERWIKVVPERMKVMLVAGAPTWDFQYVRHALSGLPEVQLKDYILDPANARLYIPPADLLAQDVIVLFDVPAAAFDEKRWDAIERVAQVAGGSVILVGGPSHLPAEYYKSAPTALMLPFRAPFKPVWSVSPLEEPAFHFDPLPEAESLEFLKLAREPEVPETDAEPRRWEQLPGFFRFLQLPEIHDDKNWKPAARPLLVEEESRLPVLTEMRLGAGRTFFVGFDETWRWRFRTGGRDQDHFWWQLIQYASEEPYFVRDGPLSLDVDKVAVEPGQSIHIRARIAEEVSDPQPTYSLDILRDARVISQQPLAPNGPAGSGRFAASVTLAAGDYELRWTVIGAGKRLHAARIPLHVAATSEAELADLSGDSKMLRKLAGASGGEFLTLEQVNRLPERLSASSDAHARYAELRLWDSPWLFALVVGCLGTEWALRKRVGLA